MNVDPEGLNMAMVLLGLRLPVEIEFKEPLSGRAGEYLGVPEGKSTHLVRLHPDLPTSNANVLAWHEMAHAMQAERSLRNGTSFAEDYEATMEAAGIVDPDLHLGIADVNVSANPEIVAAYRSTPFEFEADLLAARYAVDHAVIV